MAFMVAHDINGFEMLHTMGRCSCGLGSFLEFADCLFRNTAVVKSKM